MIAGHLQFVEHPVGLPDPMVLRLRELRLPIVAIEIGIHRIVAVGDQSSGTRDTYRNSHTYSDGQYALLLFDVSRTVVGIHAGILVRMRLNGVRVEDLHHLAEVDLLHQVVDVVVVVVVREHQQHLRNVPGLR